MLYFKKKLLNIPCSRNLIITNMGARCNNTPSPLKMFIYFRYLYNKIVKSMFILQYKPFNRPLFNINSSIVY